MCMALTIGMMYEAKKAKINQDGPNYIARLHVNKEDAIFSHLHSWNSSVRVTSQSRFVVLEHEVSPRRNRLGEKIKINVYRLLLNDGNIGWCMLPNCKTWKIVESEEVK